jgi:nucleoid DNA-binding protein
VRIADLATLVAAADFDLSHAQAGALVRVVLDGMADALSAGERVELEGLGLFTIIDAPGPSTNVAADAVSPGGRRRVFFDPTKSIVEALN